MPSRSCGRDRPGIAVSASASACRTSSSGTANSCSLQLLKLLDAVTCRRTDVGEPARQQSSPVKARAPAAQIMHLERREDVGGRSGAAGDGQRRDRQHELPAIQPRGRRRRRASRSWLSRRLMPRPVISSVWTGRATPSTIDGTTSCAASLPTKRHAARLDPRRDRGVEAGGVLADVPRARASRAAPSGRCAGGSRRRGRSSRRPSSPTLRGPRRRPACPARGTARLAAAGCRSGCRA